MNSAIYIKTINLQAIIQKELEKSFSQQTEIILTAVDQLIDKRLEKMELRINSKFDKLVTTLDKFLKNLLTMKTSLR